MTGLHDIREDHYFVGRSEELAKLVEQINRGRHTLLLGERGVGKTRLMKEGMEILTGKKRSIHIGRSTIYGPQLSTARNLLYVWHSSPLGDCLKEICCRLHEQENLKTDFMGEVDAKEWAAVKKKLNGLGSVGVQNLIIDSIRGSGEEYVLFFDSLDRISPAHQPFLERLMSIAIVCASVVRPKEGEQFRKIWSSFARINLLPLTSGDSEKLINHLLDSSPVHLLDRSLYVRQLLKATGGNPFHLRNMLWHGTREKRLGEEEIRSLQRIEEGELMNMGPAYIFLASVFTLFKIFSIGTDRSEFYVYFSSLGFLVYLTFRVFRNFFLFRPQRRR